MACLRSALLAVSLFGGEAFADEMTVRLPSGESTTLTHADIEALGTETLTTTTPWTEGKVEFTGVTGARLVEALEISADLVTAVALNDYIIDFEFDAFASPDLLIATRMNGEPMPVARFGPFWIMFDFDNASQADAAVYGSQAVWQLIELEFHED